ncbi:MAG: DNA gyrase subunit A, partial [Alphaproteobacteria bacterium]
VKGPDLPTGGVCIEPQENIVEAYKTGRGGFRIRARWELEELSRGQWQIIVTEIPYQVQKARLIEKIAELMLAKKLPLVGDVRDESADDIRLVLEPRAKTVDPAVMMEQLFRNTDLETRIPLNMNVLDADHTPRVMSLGEVLKAFLDHRQDVLQRRSKFRLDKIEQRLEVLGGYLIAYLNLDEVIRIIREEDEPKKELIKAFNLTERQAEAILNMRLRSLRKLEEMEIRTENKELEAEAKSLRALLKSDDKQWATIADEIKALKADFGQKTELGKRRTDIAEAPDVEDVPLEDMIEKEPVTVILSTKGWVRTQKGHLDEEGRKKLKFKEGDKELYAVHAQSTDKMVAFGTNGRFYTLPVDRLPGGRGHGEPIRLLVDLPNDHDLISLTVFDEKRKLLVVASDGRGFFVNEAEVIAQTKNGKQVLNVKGEVEAQICAEVPDGVDHLAIIGENRKLLVFPIKDEVPEMTRGRGVILQRYKDGGVSDAIAFTLADGLPTPSKLFDKKELTDWIGTRAQAGRIAPRGFPRSNRFAK